MIGTFAQSINSPALGLFSKVFDPTTNDPGKFRYLRFVEMPSIYAHLPEKRQAKVREAYMRKADTGKNPNYFKNMGFRTTLFDLKSDGVVLMAEGFQERFDKVKLEYFSDFSSVRANRLPPRFVNTGTGGSVYSYDQGTGNMYISRSQTTTVYDPINDYLKRQTFGDKFQTESKFTPGSPYIEQAPPRLAILVGLDKEGEKQWDNCIILESPLNKKLQVGSMGGDSLILAYFQKESITSKLIYQNTTLVEEETQYFKNLFPATFSYEFPIHFERLDGALFVLKGNYTNPINGESFMFLRLMRYTVQ
jgi:hypothetical protein